MVDTVFLLLVGKTVMLVKLLFLIANPVVNKKSR